MSFYKKLLDHREGIVHFTWGIVFVIGLVGLYGIVYSLDRRLPTLLKIEDEVEHPDSFIGERARNYLKPLTDLGPRVTGSHANEKCAVEYLMRTLRDIKEEAHPIHEISLTSQRASGSFLIDDDVDTIFAYSGVQNVIARIHSCNETAGSILLNAHFDSRGHSPGASDAGINVAVALEVFRKMSQTESRPENNVIFLFNGAEETYLTAAHGFITQHKWSEDISVVINLDAMGSGGREILFQVGPDQPWLFDYYRDIPHPHCNVLAEELFLSGMIPSDTDFKSFRHFGGIIGFDMAQIKDGYRYHTKYDNFDNIENGSFQHTGDNVLHLMKKLADAPEVFNPMGEDRGTVVFYDFLGLFYIQYDADTIAPVINILVVFASTASMIWTCEMFRIGLIPSLVYLPVTAFVKLLGIMMNHAVLFLVGALLDAANSTMSWYGTPAIICSLYIAPTILLQLLNTTLIHRSLENRELPLTKKILLQIHANRLLWSIVLFIGTISNYRSIYMVMIPVLFNTLAMCIIQCFKLHKYDSIWFTVYVICSILPTMELLYISHETLSVFIPVMSRMGPNTNPEFIIGGFMLVLMTSKIASYFTPLALFVRKQKYLFAILLAIFLAGFVTVLTPAVSPYRSGEQNPALQRYTVYHSERIYTNASGDVIKNDAGFYFYKQDRNNPRLIPNNATGLESAVSLADDCNMAIVCGLPRRDCGRLKDNFWIPAEFPVFPNRPTCFCSRSGPTQNQYKFECNITGSDRMDVYLSIRHGLKLVDINLIHDLPDDLQTWRDQPTYHISFVSGHVTEPLLFNFILEEVGNHTDALVDLAISTRYIHEELIQKTDQYMDFLNQFPDWTELEGGLAHYQSIVLT